MNDDIARMILTPGRYAVSDANFGVHGRYVMVEVEDDGTTHQLNKKGERDGVLLPDGWAQHTQVYMTDERERVFVRLGHPDEKVTHA